MAWKAADARALIQSEISKGTFNFSDTNQFLTHFFPVRESDIDAIYDILPTNVYDKTKKRWSNLPDTHLKHHSKNSVYEPLVTIMNAILAASSKIRRRKEAGKEAHHRVLWFDNRNQAPVLGKNDDAIIARPELVLMLATNEKLLKWEEIFKKAGEDVSAAKAKSQSKKARDDEINAIKRELNKVSEAWWQRVCAPAEIQVDPNADIELTIYQLFMFMEQMRHDKPDRSFFFGFVFSARKLSIWLSDRSGMLGTSTPFDIHQHPRAFIRVISAFCLLSPTRLGWDPKMSLCKVPLTRLALSRHSFDPSIQLDDILDNRSEAHWAIDVPSRNNPFKTEKFITLLALTPRDSRNMCGRSTRVWAAVRAGEFRDAKPFKIYVIKQTWRPTTMIPEAYFYLLAKARGVDVLDLYSYTDSTTTKSDIRRDVPCYLPKEVAKGSGRLVAIRKGQKSLALTDHRYRHPALTLLTPVTPLTWRVHSTLVLGTYGWPITFFKDLVELVEVLQDSITCHHQLYLQGILHRDIDSWNILICPTDLHDLNAPVKGHLADLKNATATDTFIAPWLSQYESLVTDQTARQTTEIFEFFNVQVPPALVPLLNACSRDFITFFKDLYAVFPELEGKGKLTDEDFGLGTSDMPNFWEHSAENTQCSATASASAEVLVGEPMFKCPPAYNIPEGYQGLKKHPISISMARSQNHPAPQHCQPDLPGDEEQPPLNKNVVGAADPTLITESTEVPQPQPNVTGNPTVAHRSIHDMEGFLWLITRIVLERSGPGGERRDFVEDEPKQDAFARFEIFSQLFLETNITMLALFKTALFRNNTYEQVVLRYIHPYFEPLKPILLRWWQILRFAYRFPAFEDTHKHFLLAIADQIPTIKAHVARYPHQGSSSLQERRARNIASLQGIGGDPVGLPISTHSHEDIHMPCSPGRLENGSGNIPSSSLDPFVDGPKLKRPRLI